MRCMIISCSVLAVSAVLALSLPRVARGQIVDPTSLNGSTDRDGATIDLRLWLDGNDIGGDGNLTNNASEVTAAGAPNPWKDKSGYGIDLENGTPSQRPVVATGAIVAGKDAVVFDGADDYLRSIGAVAASTGSTGTLFLVFRTPANGVSYRYFAEASDSINDLHVTPLLVNDTDFDAATQSCCGGAGFDDFGADLVANTTYIAMVRHDGSDNTILSLNGGAELSESGLWFDDINVNNTSVGAMDRANGPDGHVQGPIAAVVLYDGNLTTAQIADVESFLNTQHVIVIPEPSSLLLAALAVVWAIGWGSRTRRLS